MPLYPPSTTTITPTRAPTGSLGETYPRGVSNGASNIGGVTSGTLRLHGVPLKAGDTIANISLMSGATPAAISTHCWFALYSPARALLRVTSDDTAASPWAANTLKTLPLASSYVVPISGMYYIGLVVVATTPPTHLGISGVSSNLALAAVVTGNTTDTGLTTPATAPDPAGAITASANVVYGYVS